MGGARVSHDRPIENPSAATHVIATKTSTCWAISALALSLALFQPNGASAGAARPNIVVVITDDQRWDMVGAAGNHGVETPSIDRLAREGVYFRQATAYSPQCIRSRASLLTGLPPHEYEPRMSNRATDTSGEVALPMLPRALRAAGYRTVFIGKWHLDFTPEQAGFSDIRTWLSDGLAPYRDPPTLLRGSEIGSELIKVAPGSYTNEIFGNDAVEFLEHADASKPFFLWLALTAPHEPYGPNPDEIAKLYAGKTERELRPPGLALDSSPPNLRPYYEAVSVADRQLGRVLEALDRRKLAATTLVVFLSDNGLMLGERGAGTRSKETHGKRLPYEGSIRIPMIVRGPAITPGAVSDATVSSLDVPPTILAEAQIPPEPRWRGRNLSATLRGKSDRGPQHAFVEFTVLGAGGTEGIDYRAVRTRTHKLIVWSSAPTSELYDLAADPHEQRNLIADPSTAAKRRELFSRLREWFKTTNDPAALWKSVTKLEH
jgi:arylsulfatase A-like enzyme